MKLNATLCASALLCLSAAGHAADTPKTSVRADRGASQPGGNVSPAVRAAESAEVPGDMRSEKRAVPQISIPLKGKATAGAAPSAATGNGIDDDAARCLAKKTKRERAKCQRVGAASAPAAVKR